MLLSVKELLWKPAAIDCVEDRIAQPKQIALMATASPGVVVVRARVKVSSCAGNTLRAVDTSA